MYIPEFWCGVIFTILTEISLVIAAAAMTGKIKTKDKEDKKK